MSWKLTLIFQQKTFYAEHLSGDKILINVAMHPQTDFSTVFNFVEYVASNINFQCNGCLTQ